MPAIYYNEFDRKAAAWLRELMVAGLIPEGVVDERSIVDVRPDDLDGFVQCHFFAGIGGWAYALRLAGWPEDKPVWTGSCPCQPWSIANVADGGGRGGDDPRHLWPTFYQLIKECRPSVVVGEQVKNAIRKGWLDEVFADLEAIDYACGAALLPASAAGARHERGRIYWCGHSGGARWEGHQSLERIPGSTAAPQPINGDPLAQSWGALDGNIGGLLHSNGLSVVMERHALKGYGNAIVPQVAAKFIQAVQEIENLTLNSHKH